jgi:hypothetical protein
MRLPLRGRHIMAVLVDDRGSVLDLRDRLRLAKKGLGDRA